MEQRALTLVNVNNQYSLFIAISVTNKVTAIHILVLFLPVLVTLSCTIKQALCLPPSLQMGTWLSMTQKQLGK